MVKHENQPMTEPRVLVVEDDPTVQGFIRRALKREGYDCIVAGTAEEALHISSEEEQESGLDLLILDIMLPDSWGTRLMQDIWSQHPNVKVVLMSGFIADDPILAAGVQARDPEIPFLSKPFSHEALIEAVEKALATRRSTPPGPGEAGLLA
jgi:DNA-binding NtrC family response regulator